MGVFTVEKSSEKTEQEVEVPTKWLDAFRVYLPEADRFRLSWRCHNRGAWITLGDDRPVRTTEVETADGPIYMYDAGDGPIRPEEIAAETWSDLFEKYADERRRRGGALKMLLAQVELYTGEEKIFEAAVTLKPKPGATGIASPLDTDVEDPETAEERRDRNLLREMRRERGQLFGMIRESLEMQHQQANKMGAMVETVASAFGGALDLERALMAEERQRIMELREGDLDDRRTEQLLGMLERLASKVMHQKGVNVQPGADGVDPLLAHCRDLQRSITPEQWDELATVHSEVFADLRTVLDKSTAYDATRDEIFAAAQAVLVEVQNASVRGELEAMRVVQILGPETLSKLDGLRELIAGPE